MSLKEMLKQAKKIECQMKVLDEGQAATTTQ